MKSLVAPVYAAFFSLAIFAGNSYAALDAAVTDKIAEVTTDLGILGGLFLIAYVVIAGYGLMTRGAR